MVDFEEDLETDFEKILSIANVQESIMDFDTLDDIIANLNEDTEVDKTDLIVDKMDLIADKMDLIVEELLESKLLLQELVNLQKK